jgi:hypothetical protein
VETEKQKVIPGPFRKFLSLCIYYERNGPVNDFPTKCPFFFSSRSNLIFLCLSEELDREKKKEKHFVDISFHHLLKAGPSKN